MQSSSKLKVLFQNRPKNQWIGGDMIQLEKTMDAIKNEVDLEFNDQPLYMPALLLGDFDIAHLWNFSMEWTKYQVWAAKRHGLKIVCSMIYHKTERFIPYHLQQVMIDEVDACIFLSQGEVARAKRHLIIPDEKIHIIPNGIDSYWLKTPKQTYARKGYVLTVGRLDGTKGQLETARACKELNLEYLCVGEILDVTYANQCEAAGATLLGAMKHRDLIPIYDNASVFVLASTTELFPLSVMEAGARGINSVVTTTCEWKDIPGVEWCHWGDDESIKASIEKSVKKPKNLLFKRKLKEMTWEKVGEQVLDIYKTIWQKKDVQN